MLFRSERETKQLQPDRSRCRFVFRFERRLRRRHKKQSIQAKFFHRRLRHEQMTEVNRIKRAAKNSEFHVESCRFKGRTLRL